jgi:hypothetical protein
MTKASGGSHGGLGNHDHGWQPSYGEKIALRMNGVADFVMWFSTRSAKLTNYATDQIKYGL